MENSIHLEDFYVFSHNYLQKHYIEFPFVHSTNIFPEWPFAKVGHTSDELANRVSVALLEMSAEDPAALAAKCFGWTVPLNYQSVHDCLKELRVSPYKDYGRITTEDVIRKYWVWIAGIIAIVSIAIIISVYVFNLIQRLHEVINISQDEIANRKKAEKEKQILTSQLHQADKMSSVGQLAAGVAHEINNPVGYILSNLNTMNKYLGKITTVINELTVSKERDDRLDELTTDFKDAISESLEGADRVKKIVSDLTGFSRVDNAEPELTNLNKGLESTLNVVWNKLKYHCEVKKDLGYLPEVSCFPSQINQIFLNLLVNAGHATKDKAGIINMGTWSDETSVYVSIKDNGCGISQENLSKIFEPFFTTKDVGEGTGLGLSLAHDIIAGHQGTIDVKSVLGEGTEFVISLPLKSKVQSVADPVV